MNGKQAKLLRKLGRSDKKSKGHFNNIDHNTKGKLRQYLEAYITSEVDDKERPQIEIDKESE